MENAEVLMLKNNRIFGKYNYMQALESLCFPLNGNISQYVVFYLVNLQNTRQNHKSNKILKCSDIFSFENSNSCKSQNHENFV